MLSSSSDSTYAPLEISTPEEARAWQPPRGPFVLLVAYSRFGYGHVARCLKLAHAFRTCTSLEPVVVSGHPEFVRSLPDVPFRTLSLPPYLASDVGDAGTSSSRSKIISPLPEVPVEHLALYRGHLLALLADKDPSAILIDHFPFSGAKSEAACGELVDLMIRKDSAVPIFSGYRGLVSERFLREENAAEIVSRLLPSVERVFVFLDEEARDTVLAVNPFLRPFRSRLEFVGHVGPEDVPRDPPESGLVLATFGSGMDAYRRIEVVCEAFSIAHQRRPELRLEVVTGRRLGRSLYESLAAAYTSESVEIHRHVDRLPRRFPAAELLVCCGGYNTLVEASSLASGKIVSIPISWSATSEQLQTARRFEAVGAIDLLLPHAELEPRRLADRLLQVLDGPIRRRPTLDLQGAVRAARCVEQKVADVARS
jgi:predicted glycosyltransferase